MALAVRATIGIRDDLLARRDPLRLLALSPGPQPSVFEGEGGRSESATIVADDEVRHSVLASDAPR